MHTQKTEHLKWKMKLLTAVFLLYIAPSKLSAYRDGARENSCYDHAIDHGTGTEIVTCIVKSECPYFLNIRAVIDEDTLELGDEMLVDAYECEKIYGSKRTFIL